MRKKEGKEKMSPSKEVEYVEEEGEAASKNVGTNNAITLTETP